MTALIVVLLFVAFVGLDALVRIVAQRMQAARVLREREEVLRSSVRLDFTHEAKTLKRVEVPNARARILAVDDEPVILDSFRKILVLDGFDVDTVESGPEALGLVQRRDYDFVFTDLKMPDMDGVEVVKAVKHLRPDIDVVVVTGYGTIETAVATMQHGAVEYVQKPFTAGELSAFARKILIQREARLQAQRRPTVRVVNPLMAEAPAANEFCVPGGAFVAPGHTWVRIEAGGQVRVGIDDFAGKALGSIDGVDAPAPGRTVRQGEPLFAARRGTAKAQFAAPLSGTVVAGNGQLKNSCASVRESPYDRGWVCILQPADLAGELKLLRIGKPAVEWYQDEIDRLRKKRNEGQPQGAEAELQVVEQEFLGTVTAQGIRSAP